MSFIDAMNTLRVNPRLQVHSKSLMRFHKLDLNLLVALDAMLSEASISRAAEQLHMSQSAMSNALARLREHFQDRLLVQVGRKMELTPRAQVLLEAVRDVLLRVDTTITAQPVFDAATSDREFRIFVSDYSLMTLIPHVVALAYAQSHTVRFRFLPQVGQPQRALDQGDADMLLLPQNYCSADHPTETLWSEEFVCLVWSESAHVQRPLTLANYTQAAHVVMQPTISVPSFESAFLKRMAIERRIDVTTHSFSAVPALLVGTERIATMHRRLAHVASQFLPVTLLAPPVDMPIMYQALQWHKYRTQDPALIWLRGIMQTAAQRMDAKLPKPVMRGVLA